MSCHPEDVPTDPSHSLAAATLRWLCEHAEVTSVVEPRCQQEDRHRAHETPCGAGPGDSLRVAHVARVSGVAVGSQRGWLMCQEHHGGSSLAPAGWSLRSRGVANHVRQLSLTAICGRNGSLCTN